MASKRQRESGQFNLQGFVDVRYVASLAQYFIEHKMVLFPKLADVQKNAVEILAQNFITKGYAQEFTTDEAIDYLSDMGFAMGQLSDRRSKSINTARVEEHIKEDFVITDPAMMKIAQEAMDVVKRRKNSDIPVVTPDYSGHGKDDVISMPSNPFALPKKLEPTEYSKVGQSDEPTADNCTFDISQVNTVEE